MNPVEEHQGNAVAFAIARRHGPFDCYIRNFELQKKYLGLDIECDLLAIRGGDYIECFEIKLGAHEKSPKKDLREQLDKRRETGLFNRVWGIWDRDLPTATARRSGFGTMMIEYAGTTTAVSPVEAAPDLAVRGSRSRERLLEKLRGFPTRRVKGQVPVFLRCPACPKPILQFYAMDYHEWVEQPPVNTAPTTHAWFCEHSPHFRAKHVSMVSEDHRFDNDEWTKSYYATRPICRLRA